MVAIGNAKVLFSTGMGLFCIGMIFLFFISYRRSGKKASTIFLLFLILAGFVLVMESSRTLHYARSVGTAMSFTELEEEKVYEILLPLSILSQNIAMVGAIDPQPDIRLVHSIPQKMTKGTRFKIFEKKVIKGDFVIEAPKASI